MLIEFWERLRGYDTWLPAQARVTAAKVRRTAHNGRDGSVSYSYSSRDRIEWMDFHGQKQSAEFRIADDSPLYQLIGGETFSIRYDPQNAGRFCFRELLRTRIRRVCKLTFYALGFLGFAAALLLLHLWTLRP